MWRTRVGLPVDDMHVSFSGRKDLCHALPALRKRRFVTISKACAAVCGTSLPVQALTGRSRQVCQMVGTELPAI